MKLNKEQEKAFKDLKIFCENYLDDNFEAIPSKTDLKKIERVLGIKIPLVHHSQIEELYRNKSEAMHVKITYSNNLYMIGKTMKMYLPFQIKKMKEKRF